MLKGLIQQFGQGFASFRTFLTPGIRISSMSQEFLEIWAGVPLKPDHSRSGLVPYKYGVICPSARYIKPCIKGLLPVGLLH